MSLITVSLALRTLYLRFFLCQAATRFPRWRKTRGCEGFFCDLTHVNTCWSRGYGRFSGDLIWTV